MSENEVAPTHTLHTYIWNESQNKTLCESCGITPIEGEWYLGHDSDCELCGSSNNVVTFEEWDDGEYQLYMSVGCYGGESYTIDQIDQLIDAIKGYEDFSEEMEADIRNTVSRYIERVGK